MSGKTSTIRFKNNLTGTLPPTSSDDSTLGYSVGSAWIDTVQNNVYFCTDNTAGAAFWSSVTGGVVDLFVAVGNGTQTVFTASDFSPSGFTYVTANNSLTLFVDGVRQLIGGSYAYTETSTTSVTFSDPIPDGSVIMAYVVSSPGIVNAVLASQKATLADAQAGTSDTTWVTPYLVQEEMLAYLSSAFSTINIGAANGFQMHVSGTKLYFQYNGTNIASLDSTGKLIISDVTIGTP